MKTIYLLFLALLFSVTITGIVYAQAIPRLEENIPFLVTFGPNAPEDWGDDDHVSTFFISIPEQATKSFYIKVFDPNIGGAHDEEKSGFNTRCKFSIYGGKGTFSNLDARSIDPIGNYRSGNLLFSKVFDDSPKYDDQWYTFGPINPLEGEKVKINGNTKLYFKIICEGVSGDDGNLFRYYISEDSKSQIPLEGCEPFTFEYTFRMGQGVSHLYPFIDQSVIRVRQNNYDFDGDGYLRICSLVRKSEIVKPSNNGQWSISTHEIYAKERGACMDLQIVSKVERRNNNMVFYITNQYGEALPFMNFPIGLEQLSNRIKVSKN